MLWVWPVAAFFLLQNYENMFYSYSFSTGPAVTQPFKPRFTAGGGRSPVTGEQEQWVGMSFNSMYDGKGMKTHGRPHLNLAIGGLSCVPRSSLVAARRRARCWLPAALSS